MPPVPSNVTRTEVLVAHARASPNTLRYFVPPASSAPKRRHRYRPRVFVKPRYRMHVPVRHSRVVTKAVNSTSEIEFEGHRRAPLSILSYLRNLEMVIKSKRFGPRSHVAYRPAYSKVNSCAH